MAHAASVRASRRYILVARQALHAQISGQVLSPSLSFLKGVVFTTSRTVATQIHYLDILIHSLLDFFT
ncbi:hypothetical protein QT995_10120 [Microcoleus sp. S36b_A3]|uniref:hypothetical protein n=1 Tax=unclassified Microcoleus TaxID=2642155 RepID=UPI002FCEF815